VHPLTYLFLQTEKLTFEAWQILQFLCLHM